MILGFRGKQKKGSDDVTPMRPQECEHKWQDFPWYLNSNYYYDNKTLEYQIIEPYVCVKCKKKRM